MMEAKAVLSVSELTMRVKGLIDGDDVLASVYVRGELSNYKIYPSGHHYFTLKDAECSLKCVMFRASAQRLRFRPENGLGVTVSGRVSVFPRDGAYQLYCASMIPEGTGDLQIAFEQLKRKLSDEGLFDENRKKKLPRYPRRIALVTSSAGAAVRDMIRILSQRWPLTKVLVLPVKVQGEDAPAEIAAAIRFANDCSAADIIITGRGGGSMEDLWAFNDERVARAIFDSRIPVISAVGHEPDVTISDYAADMRASTPSNAAEIAVPDRAEMRAALESCGIRAAQAVDKKLRQLRMQLDQLGGRRVMTEPGAFIDERRLELDRIREKLASVMEARLSACRREQIRLASSLDAMSPLRVLTRGYSIATGENGEVIRSVRSLEKGAPLRLRLGDGSADCRVEKVYYGHDRPEEQ